MNRQLLIWFFVLILPLPIILPFLRNGYFPTQDGGWAVVRVAEMHREIKELQIPPRWAGFLNHGYGYPLFLFTYPFPYYVGEVFHITGLNVINSIKLVFILSVIGSGTAMFLLGRKLWGTGGGLISTVFYLYAPYRFTNLFIRGSLGESLAFVFFPLLFWLFKKILEHPSRNIFTITTLILSAFILTHNVMVVLFLPFLFMWIFSLVWKSKTWTAQLKVVLTIFGISLLLTSFFWLPVILEKKYIYLSQTPLANKLMNFVTLNELFSSNWDYATRPPLKIGLWSVSSAILGFFSLLITKKNQTQKNITLYFFGTILVTFLMLFPFSFAIWQLPLIREIDFPWRDLGIVIFLLALVSGSLVKVRYGKVFGGILSLLVLITNMHYIQTRSLENKSSAYFETNDATTTSADELMPIWVKEKPTNRPDSKINLQSSGKTKIIKETSTQLITDIESAQNNTLFINTVYFPGWKAFVNDQETVINVASKTGLMSISVPSGSSRITFAFRRTLTRLIADILTSIGIISLCIVLWFYPKKLRPI